MIKKLVVLSGLLATGLQLQEAKAVKLLRLHVGEAVTINGREVTLTAGNIDGVTNTTPFGRHTFNCTKQTKMGDQTVSLAINFNHGLKKPDGSGLNLTPFEAFKHPDFPALVSVDCCPVCRTPCYDNFNGFYKAYLCPHNDLTHPRLQRAFNIIKALYPLHFIMDFAFDGKSALFVKLENLNDESPEYGQRLLLKIQDPFYEACIDVDWPSLGYPFNEEPPFNNNFAPWGLAANELDCTAATVAKLFFHLSKRFQIACAAFEGQDSVCNDSPVGSFDYIMGANPANHPALLLLDDADQPD